MCVQLFTVWIHTCQSLFVCCLLKSPSVSGLVSCVWNHSIFRQQGNSSFKWCVYDHTYLCVTLSERVGVLFFSSCAQPHTHTHTYTHCPTTISQPLCVCSSSLWLHVPTPKSPWLCLSSTSGWLRSTSTCSQRSLSCFWGSKFFFPQQSKCYMLQVCFVSDHLILDVKSQASATSNSFPQKTFLTSKMRRTLN